jgi:hypothetical protein
MGKQELGMIEEIGGNVERFAGKEVRVKVMKGCSDITAKSNKIEIAMWVKGAIARLDCLVDEKTRSTVMEHCGYKCSTANQLVIDRAKKRCHKFRTIEDFLEVELKKPPKGMRLERRGNVLYQYYTPQAYTTPMRCYCSLLRGLPASETISISYCRCSQAFVQRYWETILGKPVQVKLVESAVSGAKECKFAIHL